MGLLPACDPASMPSPAFVAALPNAAAVAPQLPGGIVASRTSTQWRRRAYAMSAPEAGDGELGLPRNARWAWWETREAEGIRLAVSRAKWSVYVVREARNYEMN